jgi:hypothetical protein
LVSLWLYWVPEQSLVVHNEPPAPLKKEKDVKKEKGIKKEVKAEPGRPVNAKRSRPISAGESIRRPSSSNIDNRGLDVLRINRICISKFGFSKLFFQNWVFVQGSLYPAVRGKNNQVGAAESEGLEIAWFTVGSFSNSPHYHTSYAISITLTISAERSSGTREMVV